MATKPLPVHGADISHHQANVDLVEAQDAGLDWLAHKATQGNTFIDTKHETRQLKARSIRLPFLSYHFAEDDNPLAQLAHFLEVAGIKPGDLRPMLDLEDDVRNGSLFSRMSIQARTAWVKAFVDGIKKEIGVAPFIYTPFDLGSTFDCPLWVARYSPTNEMPRIPQPWNNHTIRQFTNGVVGVPKSFPGLGNVDLNCWNGDPDRLLDIFMIKKPGTVTPPVVVKPPVVVTEPTPLPKPPAVTNEPDRPMRAPRKSLSQWGGFVHLLARFYQDYEAAVATAAKRKKRRAVDVDVQESKQGTGWALHWATLGKNKLHDPKKKYGKNTRIDLLTDAEIERMRGPKNQKPQRLSTILRLAESRNVRVEVELKTQLSKEYLRRLMSRPYVKELDRKGLLQFKTLAFLGYPNGAAKRLRPVHETGGATILSFTDFGNRKGISKEDAWPVVDYVRGTPKWVA